MAHWIRLETFANGTRPRFSVGYYAVRGGAFDSGWEWLAPNQAYSYMTIEGESKGFRVGCVPEPASVAMLIAAGVGVLVWRWRRRGAGC